MSKNNEELIDDETQTDIKYDKEEEKYKLIVVLQKLKFNRIVNYFWYSKLKKDEEWWTFFLIILSTFTSALTVANNIETEPFKHYNTIINIGLNVLSFSTSLTGAWLKKKNYIESINTTDRYFQKLNKLCEEIDYELIKGYDDDTHVYVQKNQGLIKQYLSQNTSIFPKDWKKTVTEITNNYPEMICVDGTAEHQLWPWYTIYLNDNNEKEETNFKFNITKNIKHKIKDKNKNKDDDDNNDNDNNNDDDNNDNNNDDDNNDENEKNKANIQIDENLI